MDWQTGISQALDEFLHHKLRTVLTLLGMIFGVGAVISMLSIGAGAEREALRMIDSLGLRNVIVEAIPQPEERLREVREDSLGLSVRDLEIALETLPQVVRHTAIKEVSVHSIFSDGGRSDAQVLGVNPDHFDMSHLQLERGAFFDEQAQARYAQYCVIGSQVAQDLFGSADPLGSRLKVNHVWLTVVGVLAARELGSDQFQGVDLSRPENMIYIPLQTALKRFRFKEMDDEIDAFHLEVDQQSSIASVATTLDQLLKTRHQGTNDYKLIVPDALLRQRDRHPARNRCEAGGYPSAVSD
jgi:putative ABC transport system permease protein